MSRLLRYSWHQFRSEMTYETAIYCIIGNMATETVVLDKIDKQILSILQTDGRISWQLLGDRVHLSANAVAERVRRMTGWSHSRIQGRS